MMEAIVGMALESGGFLSEPWMDAELAARFRTARDKAVRKVLLLDAERAAVLAKLERLGV